MEELLKRYPSLAACAEDLRRAKAAWIACYEQGGKLLLCGNGGSCADAEHISGELMKGFLKRRPLDSQTRAQMKARMPAVDDALLNTLQGGLAAVPLTCLTALGSAVCNDADPVLVYAQPLMALGRPGDVLVALSTSGNAENVCAAATVAKARGLTVVALTGKNGGKLAQIADITVRVPEIETYRVQELHLPVYHYLCAATEAHFFAE